MTDGKQVYKHVVVVIGGGAAGLAVTSALLRAQPDLDIAVVEPSGTHDYQPGWTLVGGGCMHQETTRRPEADVLPQGVIWYQDAAAGFDADNSRLSLASGQVLEYRFLVVAAGLKLDWDRIEGLPETLGHNGVTSNYRYDLAPYTWSLTRGMTRGGKALFTQPAMPIKCAGAPQKAMYLSADYWRQHGVDVQVGFCNQGAAMFGVPAYARALDAVVEDYGIQTHFGHNLVAVDGPARKATFSTEDGQQTLDFDMLHVVPPQSAPDFIRDSALANEAGWLDVDRNTLQHVRHANVYGLGDCTSTPNAKTAAAVRKQFPVVVASLLHELTHGPAPGQYDGYGACPLTVSRNTVMLAEFRYDGEVVSSFPMDPRVPRRFQWWMKKQVFPWMYWNVILQGRDWDKPDHKPYTV